MPASKKSLSNSTPYGGGGAVGASQSARSIKKGNSPKSHKNATLAQAYICSGIEDLTNLDEDESGRIASEKLYGYFCRGTVDFKDSRERIIFKWSEVKIREDFFCDPTNKRRRIKRLVAEFPRGVVVTAFGSHLENNAVNKITHLLYKNREVIFQPESIWAPDSSKYEKLFWMIFFEGIWGVCRGAEQEMRGLVFRDVFQRSSRGSWSKPDMQLVRAFDFITKIVSPGIMRSTKGLWDGLVPALLNGKFKQIERVIKFAQLVESKKGNETFSFEDHFPPAIRTFEKGLIGLCGMRTEKGIPPSPPTVRELQTYMNDNDLYEGWEDSSFRKALKSVGLGWLMQPCKRG